jgi:hypothetical protein
MKGGNETTASRKKRNSKMRAAQWGLIVSDTKEKKQTDAR